MRDFTLSAYRGYLDIIKQSYPLVLRFDEYFMAGTKPESFCLIRHDVDRKPYNALRMAALEHDLGICATYYFRTKKHSFNTNIIKAIHDMGHEVGYHYECLSDANGDMNRALEDFEVNLERFRKYVPVKTISMHGRPFNPFDNRDIWRDQRNHDLLVNKYNISGEVYLDIDYTDIAYISDTGRNWSSARSNLKDKIVSKIKADFKNGQELLKHLNSNPYIKMVFQIHPERWEDRVILWAAQLTIDSAINALKAILK